ncbi:hypothetical protein H0H92_006431 [Tricholoma furcatifolium]|nr:hypothetical protein H0H92_006431 [Tricholoma furcatifolium]
MSKHPNLLGGKCLASSSRASSLQSRPTHLRARVNQLFSTPPLPRVSTASTGVSPESPYYIIDYERAAYYDDGISPDPPSLLYRSDLQKSPAKVLGRKHAKLADAKKDICALEGVYRALCEQWSDFGRRGVGHVDWAPQVGVDVEVGGTRSDSGPASWVMSSILGSPAAAVPR